MKRLANARRARPSIVYIDNEGYKYQDVPDSYRGWEKFERPNEAGKGKEPVVSKVSLSLIGPCPLPELILQPKSPSPRSHSSVRSQSVQPQSALSPGALSISSDRNRSRLAESVASGRLGPLAEQQRVESPRSISFRPVNRRSPSPSTPQSQSRPIIIHPPSIGRGSGQALVPDRSPVFPQQSAIRYSDSVHLEVPRQQNNVSALLSATI